MLFPPRWWATTTKIHQIMLGRWSKSITENRIDGLPVDSTQSDPPLDVPGTAPQHETMVDSIAGAVLLTCASLVAVDGDTIKCDGVNMRDMGDGAPFVSGYDTPEMFGNSPKCEEERELGRAAKRRMEQLLATPGPRIYDSGEVDRTRQRRPLVWVILSDGRSAGSILINEGLAEVWTPEYEAAWCE